MVQIKPALDILEEMGGIPAVPFFEHRVLDHFGSQAKVAFIGRRNVSVRQDPEDNGTIRVEYRPKSAKADYVMTAHADHPGFVLGLLPDKSFSAKRLGLFSEEQCTNARVLLHHHLQGGHAEGRITDKLSDGLFRIESDGPTNYTMATPDFSRVSHRNRFNIIGDRVVGPAMDDLAGAAMGLETMQRIVQEQLPINASLIFYRGEEEGFIGIYDMINRGVIDPYAVVISLETSSDVVRGEDGNLEQAAKLGRGPILRTGDKTRELFEEATLELLRSRAEYSGVTVQEKRMRGGRCDANLMYAMNLMAACVCLPLKHYHNGLYTGDKFVREEISARDLAGGVELCVGAADRLASNPKITHDLASQNRRIVDGTGADIISLVRERRNKHSDQGYLLFKS